MANYIQTDNKDSMIKSWGFDPNEELELKLAETLADLAKQNGISVNELQHSFPLVLRMFKSKSKWAE